MVISIYLPKMASLSSATQCNPRAWAGCDNAHGSEGNECGIDKGFACWFGDQPTRKDDECQGGLYGQGPWLFQRERRGQTTTSTLLQPLAYHRIVSFFLAEDKTPPNAKDVWALIISRRTRRNLRHHNHKCFNVLCPCVFEPKANAKRCI